MCNRRVACLSRSLAQSEYAGSQRGNHQAVYSVMDSPSAAPPSDHGSHSSSNDEALRFKFLCSFGGSIMPRPQDGKLRYVGGETRIVCLPREITYEELMNKMKELYEAAAVLKYQQPDEDLDALVSVVNDDDVTNMMEEYDKLGSGEGVSRLRIFLFSNTEQDGLTHYIDGVERDTERRYVDALNNMNDPSDFWRQQQSESAMMRPVDDMHLAEQFFNPISLEGSIHSQRNSDMPVIPFNLHQLTVPHLGSGQYQQPVNQRYGEMDAQWSPVYYSPRHHGRHDPKADFPSSPSSARFAMSFGELPERGIDRMPDDHVRPHAIHQPNYDHQGHVPDNLMWLHAAGGDKAGFQGSILNGANAFDGGSTCEHCRMSVPKNNSHIEQPNMGNCLPLLNNSCLECLPNLENHVLNTSGNLHHGIYQKEQIDPHVPYKDGWILQNQLSPRVEDARAHISGAGRLNDHYLADGSSSNFHVGPTNLTDGRHSPRQYAHQCAGPELSNDIYHDQAVAAHLHIPLPEEYYVRYGNVPPDSMYTVSHGHVPPHGMWRNVQNPVYGAPPYETSGTPQLINGAVSPVFLHTPEESPRLVRAIDNQTISPQSSPNALAFDGNAIPEFSSGHGSILKLNTLQENKRACVEETGHSPRVPLFVSIPESINGNHVTDVMGKDRSNITAEGRETSNEQGQAGSCQERDKVLGSKPVEVTSSPVENGGSIVGLANKDNFSPKEKSETPVNHLRVLPELIDSMKRAALEGEEANTGAKENKGPADEKVIEEGNDNESDLVNTQGELELDSDNDANLKIEPTKAEEEAIARGLQTIRNEDLEEIRVLGSGTYGAVFHGKWKGSDVAIKRIKASCFAGRPSERERLISDFWREALILSSLHHPNVVSFYGIVRDGPDGSLATVTEFMVNGSLKQFLQKKDRTIDRRKRLIIAMDAAFGMEYLHGKNIVHFDLKCENLLVNMRDPQRPICKIGDLGLSKVKQHTLVSGGVRGTLPWMAPELLSGKSNMVTEKIDVYSFGIVMWELLTGEEPYSDMHCASIIGGIVNNSLRPQIPVWCDPEWKSLMESCWSSDPSERPSFTDISQKLRSMAAAINVK
ncbi:uncharacterized protein LOC115744540 isoform X1 [Rhodamnia argentea]|uniref:Uncharacterized protein LOC115744540 isoform X1 n=1 Tax=Rhodamnia argentea TaxID=178133 RepID=A0A8B8PMM8_9MYRT|nr:uncharacterized protein LOC115744540 isoform X1 [Rhodamnia argentea]XP_030535627.1 uncharacterized protein LOC115744540 isoform X1 [Rhodamnia argentea]XP_048133104.1 uncharacterized protein LOC115744540 isoform X1 [Rhodamnia argentea]